MFPFLQQGSVQFTTQTMIFIIDRYFVDSSEQATAVFTLARLQLFRFWSVHTEKVQINTPRTEYDMKQSNHDTAS